MRQLGTWSARVGAGFLRACAVVAVTMLVPAVWAGAVALGIHWGAANPWSWVAPAVLVCAGTLALSRPVCRIVRLLIARWTGTVIPAGHREAPPVTRMSTGYWWNGFGYERTRRDALMDQRRRLWWNDPANRRDLRFTAIVPFTAGLVALLPPAGAAAAVLGLVPGHGPSGASPASADRSARWWPSPSPRTPGGRSSRSPCGSCAPRPRWRWPGAWRN